MRRFGARHEVVAEPVPDLVPHDPALGFFAALDQVVADDEVAAVARDRPAGAYGPE